MIGKIKALGLALVAIAAMSAVAAGSAQAKSGLDVGTAGAGNATLTAPSVAGQEFIYTIQSTKGDFFNANCATPSLEATISQGYVQEVTATATYTGCKLFGLASTVTMHGCKYIITTTTTAFTANVDITGCTAGKKITIKNLTCTLEIGEQNGLSHLVFTNQANNHVTLQWTVSNVKVKQVGAGCPDGNGHENQKLSVTASTTMTAFTDTGTEQVTEHGHQFTKSKHQNVALALSAT